MVLAVIGGFNSNQILKYIDWDLIRENPKILCGFSDITALNNAIYAKTDLVSYSGPTYSTFAEKQHFDYTFAAFTACLFQEGPFEVRPSMTWTDDRWYMDQDNRHPIPNDGTKIINDGVAEGTLLGGNLCTINLLQGTEYMPSLKDSILFLEDDEVSSIVELDRNLQSLIHLPDFNGVRGLVIGRFQKASKSSLGLLTHVIKTKKELDAIPVIVDADFGHTQSMITFPIGGKARISANGGVVRIEILEH